MNPVNYTQMSDKQLKKYLVAFGVEPTTLQQAECIRFVCVICCWWPAYAKQPQLNSFQD